MPDDAPDPIILAVAPSSKNAFPQQGSWNMLDISNAAINGTLGALSRYSAARVNPYVAVVGETLCSIFQLTHRGRSHIDGAIEKLKVVGTLGKTLEIGFGMEDVVRVMAKTDEGRVCLALCAALTECYSMDLAIGVLIEMARHVKVDGQFMPSSASWKELLTACSGILSASKFPVLAEHFMQIGGDKGKLGVYHAYDSSSDILRGCSDPHDIASALFQLAAVTRGELEAVTFHGSADTGWIAAISQWFFDLNIVIYSQDVSSGSEEKIFYQNCEEESARVRIHFQSGGKNTSSNISLTVKTMVLQDIRDIFKEQGRHLSSLVVSGRLEWRKALANAFGPDFRQLLKLRESAGTAVGCAAVLFKGLTRADNVFPRAYRASCTTYCDASYGRGFVSSTLEWFPELSPMRESMEDAVKLSLPKAKRSYESCIQSIRSSCACTTCKSDSTGHNIHSNDEDEADADMTGTEEISSISETSEESAADYDPDSFCLVVLIETIISLSRALANVALEGDSLLPTRSGFEIAYGRQLGHRRCANGGMSALREIGQIAFCLDFDNNFSFGPLTEGEHAIDLRMKTILSLFSGREVFPSGGNFGAICSNGIVAFLGYLSEASSNMEDVSRIHIIPGKIIHDGKAYNQLADQAMTSRNLATQNFEELVQMMNAANFGHSFELEVQESWTELTSTLTFAPKLRVGPSALVAQISGRTGLVSCRGASSPSKTCGSAIPFSQKEIQNAISSLTALRHNQKSIFILDCRACGYQSALIAYTTYLPSEYTVFIAHKECPSCCIRAALEIDRPERPEFCFFIVS